MRAVRCGGTCWRCIFLMLAMGCLSLQGRTGGNLDGTRPATLVEVEGAIGPAMRRYIEKSIIDAAARRSSVVILRMDTPGGLDSSMRAIIKAILAAPLPVVAYVAPSGARAASAGTYILYACHIAAMAPATNLGAATPIPIGGEPGGKDAASQGEPQASQPEQPTAPESTSERKSINDAVAYIRGLAQMRGRNADWAESAVRSAASLSSQEALAHKVIEIIATDESDLLLQLDGRRVQLSGGEVTLQTRGATIVRVEPDWRDRLFMVLTHPTIAYGLLLIGIYGLLLEGYNPGAVLPGVVGALSLIVALYAFELLAVNFAGLALLILGAGLIVLEFFMPAFGSLGIGGLVAFVLGSLVLFDDRNQGFQIALPIVAGLAVAGASIIGMIAWMASKARRRPVVTGTEAMLGGMVEVVALMTDHCVVRYGGELWNAQAESALQPGQTARIVGIAGLMLRVRPL